MLLLLLVEFLAADVIADKSDDDAVDADVSVMFVVAVVDCCCS